MSTVPPKPKPGGLAFLIPVAIWIVSSVVATVLLVSHISRFGSIIDDFERVGEGETATVTLEAGGHTIWLERPGVDDEFLYGDEVSVAIKAPDGEEVPTAVYEADASYSSGGRDGTAALTFRAPVDGEYSISPIVNDFGGGTVAIGTENPNRAVGIGFAYFFGVGSIGFVIALIVAIVLLVKRGRSKKAIRAANVAAFGYPQYGAATVGYGGSGYPPPGQPQAGYGAPGHQPPGGYQPPGPYGTPPPPPPSDPYGSPPPPPPSDPYGSPPPPPPPSDPYGTPPPSDGPPPPDPFGTPPPPPSG